MNNQKFNELLFESEKSFSKLTKKSYKFNKTKEESKLNLEELGTPIKNNTNQNYQVQVPGNTDYNFSISINI